MNVSSVKEAAQRAFKSYYIRQKYKSRQKVSDKLQRVIMPATRSF